MCVVDAAYDHPMNPEEQATMPMAGGIMNMGYQCGMLWGAALAAGARAYQLHGPGPLTQSMAITAAQNVISAFRAGAKNEINCSEISQMDMQNSKDGLKFLARGGPIQCFRMAAAYAPRAKHAIDTALTEHPATGYAEPVSCTSVLAEKIGASGEHQVMAAGLAGGIGLSGGACGALGTSIWLTSMRGRAAGHDQAAIDASLTETIERFLQSSDFEFECAKIVGRQFEDIDDHAAYVRAGGCTAVIAALATPD